MPSIFGNPDDSGASESPDPSPSPVKRRERVATKNNAPPADQEPTKSNSDNEYGSTRPGIAPQQQSVVGHERLPKQRRDSVENENNGNGLECSLGSTPVLLKRAVLQGSPTNADPQVQSMGKGEQPVSQWLLNRDHGPDIYANRSDSATITDHLAKSQRQPAEHAFVAPRTPEQEPTISDYIRSSRIQDVTPSYSRTTPSYWETPTRAPRANGDTWSSANRRNSPAITIAQLEAQTPVRPALDSTISHFSLLQNSPPVVCTDESKPRKRQQQLPTLAQQAILHSSAQLEEMREPEQEAVCSMSATTLQDLEEKRKAIHARNVPAKRTRDLDNDQQRTAELQRLRQTFIEQHPEASANFLARQSAAAAQRQTVQQAIEANDRQLWSEFARKVKAESGRLAQAMASIAQKNPGWSQKRVEEQAIQSEVNHEFLKLEQRAFRKQQVKILLSITSEYVERLYPEAPESVKEEWTKQLDAAKHCLKNKNHTTAEWKQSYETLLDMGKEIQKAKARRLQDAVSMGSPSIAPEQSTPQSPSQDQRPASRFPWLPLLGCWRRDPYTNGYLVYNSFISSEEKINMFRDSTQPQDVQLYDPRVQSQAYFLDLYNNADHHHMYYPPASQHTDTHGNVWIGNMPFRSYEPHKADGDRRMEKESETGVEWLAVGASGYAGMSLIRNESPGQA